MSKKIIGIGHAIVDISCQIDDEFLKVNNLVKGSMTLIDNDLFHKLSQLKISKISSGGSVGNSIATLANFGSNCEFFGSVGDDEFGKMFIADLEKSSTKFIGIVKKNKSSATCFILITPDGERTMCTFLGCASNIEEELVSKIDFSSAKFLYLEGYLWDGNTTSNSLKLAINSAKKNNCQVAFSLSDAFCVERHRDDFIKLIKNDLDILFANEAEFLSLTRKHLFDLESADSFLKKISIENKKLLTIVTRGEKGCCVFTIDKPFQQYSTKKVEKVVDTTGAGDNFASGWLLGYNQEFTLSKLLQDSNSHKPIYEKSAFLANFLAGKIIQKISARFDKPEINEIKKTLNL